MVKLKIKDLTFTIELYKEPLKDQEALEGIDIIEPNNCGLTLKCKSKVFINKEIAKDQILPTLIHEIVHCYIYANGFDQVDWKEEVVCDFLSIYGDDIIRDSKKVYKCLLKQL